MIRFALLLFMSLAVSSQAVAAVKWNNSQGNVRIGQGGDAKAFEYFNDFSEDIFFGGATYNKTGPHPKAAELVDGRLLITLKKGMYDRDTKKSGRFELEKNNIGTNLATYHKFKVKSANKITDRVVISQIKLRKKNSNRSHPAVSVYLDRPPTCRTYLKDTRYRVNKTDFVSNGDDEHRLNYMHTYTEKRNGIFVHSWTKYKLSNMSFAPINDGKWHTIEMDIFHHETDGYCIVKIDGEVFAKILKGPTMPRPGGAYGDYAARIGVYRDSVDYTHSVEFDDWQVITYNPSNGFQISLD